MEKCELEVQTRWRTGKGEARKLRAKGSCPAICYRKGIDPMPLSLDKKKLENVLQTAAGQSQLIYLKILGDEGGQHKETVILKDLQRDHLSVIQHVDFLAVRMDELIVVETPIRLIGESEDVVRQGCLVRQMKRTLEVECLPGDIPEHVEVDISNLHLGESVHVEAVKVPAGVRILTDPKEPIVVIAAQEEEEKAKVEAEGAEEVVGEEAEGAEGKTTKEPSSE